MNKLSTPNYDYLQLANMFSCLSKKEQQKFFDIVKTPSSAVRTSTAKDLSKLRDINDGSPFSKKIGKSIAQAKAGLGRTYSLKELSERMGL